jgi:hypothetical protein
MFEQAKCVSRELGGSLLGTPYRLQKLHIYFQHVDELLAGQTPKRGGSIRLQYSVDLFTDVSSIMLGIVSLLRGYPIELKFGSSSYLSILARSFFTRAIAR